MNDRPSTIDLTGEGTPEEEWEKWTPLRAAPLLTLTPRPATAVEVTMRVSVIVLIVVSESPLIGLTFTAAVASYCFVAVVSRPNAAPSARITQRISVTMRRRSRPNTSPMDTLDATGGAPAAPMPAPRAGNHDRSDSA